MQLRATHCLPLACTHTHTHTHIHTHIHTHARDRDWTLGKEGEQQERNSLALPCLGSSCAHKQGCVSQHAFLATGPKPNMHATLHSFRSTEEGALHVRHVSSEPCAIDLHQCYLTVVEL